MVFSISCQFIQFTTRIETHPINYACIIIISIMPTTQYTKRYGLYRNKSYQEVLPVLKYISTNAEAQLKFPTMKVLKAIAKKLLLNVNEALYLAYSVQGQWPYQDNFFAQNSTQIRDIIFYRRPEEGYSSILIFLLLQTACIKMNLNDNFRIYTAQLQSTLPNFRPILAEFMQRFPFKQPSLKQLNRIYKRVDATRQEADYQNIVDNIMHLCPTYRVGQTQEVSSCTNTFTNKKHSSQYKTTIRQIQQMKRFQFQSQYSELQRPIMEQDQSRGITDYFKYESQDCYKLLMN